MTGGGRQTSTNESIIEVERGSVAIGDAKGCWKVIHFCRDFSLSVGVQATRVSSLLFRAFVHSTCFVLVSLMPTRVWCWI